MRVRPVELFDYYFNFESNMMHPVDEDDQFRLVFRFGSIRTNKKFRKFGYSSPRKNRINSIEFEIRLKFVTFTV
jgi:hypothetical protein